MKTLLYLGIIAALILTGCSSPLDKKFDRETAEADFARIVRMGMVDSADAYIMSHFMVEHELIGAQVLELDATYGDILEESKKFWEKTQGKKASELKDEKGSNENLNKDLKVSLQPVGTIQQSQWSHGIKYKLSMENISGKGIRAIKGNFVFYDPFGEKVYAIEYKYLDPIEMNEKIEREVTLRIQNTDSHQMLEYGKSNPFTVKWEPAGIVYQ